MSDADPESAAAGFARIAAGRLAEARWTLAAAAVAIAGVTFAAGGSWLLAIAAIAAVACVAALTPWRTRAMRLAEATAVRSPIDRLSALRLAAAVSDPLVVFDRSATVVQANPAAEAVFGSLRGVDLRLRFRAPEMQELIRQTLDDATHPAPVDYVERAPIERLFRVAASPVGDGTGLFVLVFRDQSEARRIDRMRADFIANASHELRTPLASIAGFIETLRGPARNDPKAQARFLEIMQAQTERMARLIDDLLSLSRLEMKPLAAPGQSADLVEVIAGVADTLTHLAAEAGVVVERNLPAEPVLAAGSRDELTQVFENLLENAIKYGRSGGRVVVSVARAPAQAAGGRPQVEASVRDFGPGISEEHIPRVTERFYRVDAESSRAQKGTGLGLAIVKHILTRYGGRLSIASQPGHGAAFTVHLPAA